MQGISRACSVGSGDAALFPYGNAAGLAGLCGAAQIRNRESISSEQGIDEKAAGNIPTAVIEQSALDGKGLRAFGRRRTKSSLTPYVSQARYYRMRLFPVAWRRTPDATWLTPIDDDWILNDVDGAGVAHLQNVRTHHLAQLGADRIHHFDRKPHRDWDGLKHGLLELRVQLVLSGCNIHYLPLANFRPQPH